MYRRGLEDPIAGSIEIAPTVPIVITEGNYLLADTDPWDRLPALFTETWFVDTDQEKRLEQLIERHIGYGMSPQAARSWANGPDMVNAKYVQSTRERADRIIPVASF